MLVQSLSRAGAVSADGLAEIAHVWRDFAPEPHTDRGELHHLIAETLNRLAQHCGAIEESDARFIARHWPYPLWPLTIREPRPDDGDLGRLREERELTVKWSMETEARRDPAPAISRSKVENRVMSMRVRRTKPRISTTGLYSGRLKISRSMTDCRPTWTFRTCSAI